MFRLIYIDQDTRKIQSTGTGIYSRIKFIFMRSVIQKTLYNV